MRIRVFVALLVLLVGRPALAQVPPANPSPKPWLDQFDYVQQLVMRSAEKIAENIYSFRAHTRRAQRRRPPRPHRRHQ